jgi:hypothetical protein
LSKRTNPIKCCIACEEEEYKPSDSQKKGIFWKLSDYLFYGLQTA